jgi:hypothetical protein
VIDGLGALAPDALVLGPCSLAGDELVPPLRLRRRYRADLAGDLFAAGVAGVVVAAIDVATGHP